VIVATDAMSTDTEMEPMSAGVVQGATQGRETPQNSVSYSIPAMPPCVGSALGGKVSSRPNRAGAVVSGASM
jgi:hypothetical protein